MGQQKKFSDFKIKSELPAAFNGDKIKIDRIFNREISVSRFKIEPSTVNIGTNRLVLEIELNGNKHIVFTGSLWLMEAIQKIPEDGFPFTTTIINDNDRYLFT